MTVKELLDKYGSFQALAEKAKQRFIEKEYVYSEAYGWENPDVLKFYELDPNMVAIPCREHEDPERKIKIMVATDKWLAYQKHKDEILAQEYFDFKNSERIAENY